MHQQPRIPNRVSSPAPRRAPSPAVSLQTNPSRTNNPRDSSQSLSRHRPASSLSGREFVSSPTTDVIPHSLHHISSESIKKLDQIVQNFYNKIASLVIHSRIMVNPILASTGLPKTSKWFELETVEFEEFREELRRWKNCGSLTNFPDTMIVEVYLDTSSLKDSQTLTIVDEDGKRWDVMEHLNSSISPSSSSTSATTPARCSEVVLERWRVALKVDDSLPIDDFGPGLPSVYKKAIVFMRSFFATVRLLPAWKFASQSSARGSHLALTPRCRIRTSEPRRRGPDPLRYPIDGRRDPTTEYAFGDLEVPVGQFSVSVTYRNDCNFRIDDSESLLSSRFMGVDENFFKPSLPQSNRASQEVPEAGTFRDTRPRSNYPVQTYGSLSTFHGDGPVGVSPISALRAVKPPGSDYTSSPPSPYPHVPEPEVPEVPSSLPVTGRMPARPSFRGDDESRRRSSISFQPFKGGPLSASPVPHQTTSEVSASPHSLNKPPSLNQPRTRTSLTAGMPATLRGGPPSQTQPGEAVVSGSPRPASRYSSSFTHRRGRSSISNVNVNKIIDDDQVSSGRQSLSSSIIQPGSGLLAEAGASSGSLLGDEDNISEFLKALDSKKTLKSFEPSKSGESATSKTVAQLSKFHMMKDSNNALGESMTSSMHLQRSSSSSSRQMANIPCASTSASSSPMKQHSPYTPYTPIIPSRLSTNSIADDSASQIFTARERRPLENDVPEMSRESTIRQSGPAAIDIPLPLSPRLVSYHRRASSVAQQRRTVIDDDDTDLPFATNRSLSLGADDREPPTMSGLLGAGLKPEPTASLPPTETLETPSTAAVIQRSSPGENLSENFIPALPNSPYGRRRYTGMSPQHRQTPPPPPSSKGSFTGPASRVSRDDTESISGEPLVFEMDGQSRRSLEDTPGGAPVASGRSSLEYKGVSRRGW